MIIGSSEIFSGTVGSVLGRLTNLVKLSIGAPDSFRFLWKDGECGRAYDTCGFMIELVDGTDAPE